MKIFTNCNIYISLWMLYSLQGILYPSGYFSQLTLFLVICLSVFYFFKVISLSPKYNNSFINALTFLVFMFTIYGILNVASGNVLFVRSAGIKVSNFDYIKYIYASLLPIYPFYYFAITNKLDKSIKVWGIIFFIVAISQYFRLQRELLRMLALIGVEPSEITNNGGYIVLSLMPLLVLYRNKIIQYLGLLLCVILVIDGMKRGAIIIGAIEVLFFFYASFRSSDFSTKFLVLLLIIAIVLVGSLYFEYMKETNDYFVQRLLATEQGNSSGRDEYYAFFINNFWSNSSFLQQLIGRGADSTIMIYVNYAHNDWLEVLTNNGLAGVVLLLYFWITFFKIAFLKECPKYLKMGLIMVFIILFGRTIFSMSYNSQTVYIDCALAYFLAKQQLYANNSKSNVK